MINLKFKYEFTGYELVAVVHARVSMDCIK